MVSLPPTWMQLKASLLSVTLPEKTVWSHSAASYQDLNDPQASDAPPVTCIISDGIMSFTIKASQQFGLPNIFFWTNSACGFTSFKQCKNLMEKGLTPLRGGYCRPYKYNVYSNLVQIISLWSFFFSFYRFELSDKRAFRHHHRLDPWHEEYYSKGPSWHIPCHRSK